MAADADVHAEVRKFLLSNFTIPNASMLTDATSLLDTGVVDSTGMLEVIDWLRTDYGIDVADEEMVPENLDSVENLTAYIGRKRAAA